MADDGRMCGALKKIAKIIFFVIVSLIMAGCLGILVCALSPSLTQMLAEQVERTSQVLPGGGQSGGAPSGVNADWLNGRGDGYVVPVIRPSGVPAAVSGKTGYEPVQESGEEIPQEEADNLGANPNYGDTGSGLNFDSTYYPYYAMLESDMRQLYNQIYANALELTKSFAPLQTVSVAQVKTVFEAVYNDHPELFWLETGYSCKYLQSGECVEIVLKYNDTVNDLDTAKQAFEAAAEQILAAARGRANDEDKERYVHDSLMQMVEYDVNAPMNQSAYSALVGKKSVCAGYARAFQYLMQKLSIPCYYCTGFAGEDHAWNIVKLGTRYRNVDVTWDDTDTPTYDYFNKTDAEYGATHMRTGLSIYLPACVADINTEVILPDLSEYINPNPTEPMEWVSKKKPTDTDAANEQKKQENLAKAGIKEEDVRNNLQEYYADCLKQLKAVGTGDKHFSNVIPASLWASVEYAYSHGDYKKGYMEEALKALGVENAAVQLQVDDLSGGYYRIYHNLYTY